QSRMARTVVPVAKLARGVITLGGTLAAPVATPACAIDQASAHIITPKRVAKLMLVVYIAGAGPYTLTVRQGAYPPAEGSTLGDLVTAGLVTVTFTFIAVDPSRHIQKDGSIWVDTAAGCTGVIWAVEQPA